MKLWRRVQRWVRGWAERMLRRSYEGPEPPKRLEQEYRLFLLQHPLASPDEVHEHAIRFAEESYRAGWTRGYEAAQREEEPGVHDWVIPEGEHVARALAAGADPNDPLAFVEPEELARFEDLLGQAHGTHRVVILDPDEPHPPGDGSKL
jgi:hypothetical protein